MQNSGLVNRLHRLGERQNQIGRIPGRQRLAGGEFLQRRAVDKLHHKEQVAVLFDDFVDVHHVGISEMPEDLGLLALPGEPFRVGARSSTVL